MHKPALLLAVLPLLAHAQTAALTERDLSRGATLPPSSAATVDEATAPLVNPAGLYFVDGAELNYLHERSIQRGQTLDGVYLGDQLFGVAALGLSLEWMRGATLPDYRRTAWTFALGSPMLALGGSFNIFNSSEDQDLNHRTSFDLGLTARPTRWLSFAGSIRNVDQPSQGTVQLPRTFDFGLAVRPLHERLTLGLDYRFQSPTGAGDGALQLLARGQVLPGLSLGAGVAHSFAPSHAWLFQVAVTLDTPHAGVTYAAGFAPGGTDHVIDVRLSESRYRGLPLCGGKVAEVDVARALRSPGSALALVGLAGQEADPYLRLVRTLERTARDPELKAVVLEFHALPETGLGKAAELREAVLRLEHAGKRVYAVLLDAGDTEYFIASAADEVVAVPQALLQINGFKADLTFAGEAMHKLGVRWDVARVGRYKNFPDLFTRASASPEQREATSALLDTDVRAYEAAVAQARHLSPARFHAALAQGLLTPEEARAQGLVDAVLDRDGLEQRLARAGLGTPDEEYEPPRPDLRAWGERRRIAIVPVLGDIAAGKSREDPLGLAKIAGAETVVHALEHAAADPRVVAIVLRVDSSGGDGLASDLIYRAVLKAREKKPVVASMGDVAASGGYYAAVGAEAVFAEPTTVTGSIGVFVVKPAAEELARKLGLSQETLRRAPMADFFSLYRPWTPAEQAAAQRWVDGFYDDFITEVARQRKLPKEQVHAVAQGRVWSGEDARARGLVDALGGLWEALGEARRRAHVSGHEDLELDVYGGAPGAFGGLLGAQEALARVHLLSPPPGLPEEVRQLALQVGLPPLSLLTPGLKARLPFELRVQ